MLDALNAMLAGIGEAPVNTLRDPLTGDVALAMNTLNEVSRKVQAQGWVCNTARNLTLPVDSRGEIPVPTNAVRPVFDDPAASFVSIRQGKLFDLVNQTFRFEGPVTLNLITVLEFSDLTESLRLYIAIKAARIFQDRAVGSPQLHGYQERDEYEALVDARHEDAAMGRWNIQKGTSGFLGGWNVADALKR